MNSGIVGAVLGGIVMGVFFGLVASAMSKMTRGQPKRIASYDALYSAVLAAEIIILWYYSHRNDPLTDAERLNADAYSATMLAVFLLITAKRIEKILKGDSDIHFPRGGGRIRPA